MAQTQTQTQTQTALAPHESSTATPIVSARVLKKRETDRRCQRMIRERTKSRIAYLEGLVEQFRSQDASGRVETLMRQLSEMKAERDDLAKRVKNIESIISDGCAREEPDAPTVATPPVHRNPPNLTSLETNSGIGVDRVYHDDTGSSSPIDPTPYVLHNKEFADYQASLRTSWTTTCNSDKLCQCCNSLAQPGGPNFNKWRYANETLTAWFRWPPDVQDIKTAQEVNDDVPIRAIVEGWGVVEQQNTHPSWLLLKGIDQNIFASCDQTERLAALTVMGLLMQAHLNPTREQTARLPLFYLKRPSHDMLRAYATEYFTWPGVRERFVNNEHRYCSNTFWKVLCNNMKFLWPYEFRDCYSYNVETGLYKISPEFRERLYDIRSWAMGNEMFQVYPELYADIPSWNSIPAQLHSSSPRGRQRKALPAPSIRSHSSDSSEAAHQPQQQLAQHRDSAQLMYSTQVPPASFTTVANSFNSLSSTTSYPFEQTPPGPALSDWAYNVGLDVFQMDAV